jgi:hypothetical protein
LARRHWAGSSARSTSASAPARASPKPARAATLAFLLAAPHRVHSIAIEGDIFDLIRDHASRLGIPTLPLEAHVAKSEFLARLAEDWDRQWHATGHGAAGWRAYLADLQR